MRGGALKKSLGGYEKTQIKIILKERSPFANILFLARKNNMVYFIRMSSSDICFGSCFFVIINTINSRPSFGCQSQKEEYSRAEKFWKKKKGISLSSSMLVKVKF